MPTVSLPRMNEVVLSDNMQASLLELLSQRSARRVFLLASATLARNTSVIDNLVSCLGSDCVGINTGIPPHTPAVSVIECAGQAKRARADLVVTIGGGSVTDAGKLVALCMTHSIETPAQFEPFFNTLDRDGNRVEPYFDPPDTPVISVPTTLSGGEFNYRAGLTDPVTGLKRIIGRPQMIPASVILSPDVSRHTPSRLFLSTGIRAMDHAVETLCSIDANPYTSALATQAIALLNRGLRSLHLDPEDLQSRLDCHVGAWLSMTGVVGRLRMGASHAIGHVLGARAGMAHGDTSCVMLPVVLRHNEPVLGPVGQTLAHTLASGEGSPALALASLIGTLNLPNRLRDCGVSESMLPDLARACMQEPWTHANPRPLKSWQDVLALLRQAY